MVRTCVIELAREAQVKGEMRNQCPQLVLRVQEGLEKQDRRQDIHPSAAPKTFCFNYSELMHFQLTS